MMKKMILFVLIAMVLSACTAPAASSTAAGAAQASSPLVVDYPDATSVRNQLAFGTLKLEGTANAVTAEQARTLLPFWQAMLSLSGNSSTVPDELNAVQNQITAGMKPEQVQAIAALKITNAQLNAFYAEKGIVVPTPVPGVTRVPGSGQNLSEEARTATRAAAAANGTTGAGQLTKTLLFDTVVKLLSERAGK